MSCGARSSAASGARACSSGSGGSPGAWGGSGGPSSSWGGAWRGRPAASRSLPAAEGCVIGLSESPPRPGQRGPLWLGLSPLGLGVGQPGAQLRIEALGHLLVREVPGAVNEAPPVRRLHVPAGATGPAGQDAAVHPAVQAPAPCLPPPPPASPL